MNKKKSEFQDLKKKEKKKKEKCLFLAEEVIFSYSILADQWYFVSKWK